MDGSQLMADAIVAFGNEIGVELSVDSDNYCCLAINDDMQLHMKFNEYFNGIVFYSELGEVPEANQHNTLKYFVHANCNRVSCEEMTFSYDEESKNIGLASLLPSNFIQVDSLKKILEKFITKAEAMRAVMLEFMQGISPVNNTTTAADPSSSNSAMASAPDNQFMRI
ncbi:MAG: type III secretion system chaperone [Puniceicoccales bacterium]|jgi:hypothetical protein|nr:type III secretion system chaperone [Puniceicoccales bacterium]